MGTKHALSAVAVTVGSRCAPLPPRPPRRDIPMRRSSRSWPRSRPRVHGRLRLGQHDRARRRPLRDRRQGRPRAARRSAQRRDQDVRHRAAAVEPRAASAERSTSRSSASTAYVLVTLVGPEFGQPGVSGIYRIGRTAPDADRRHRHVVDRASARDAILRRERGPVRARAYQGGFAVTDGHHNRVLRVGRDGA